MHLTLTFAHDHGGLRLGPRGRAFCSNEVARFVKALTRQIGRIPFMYTLESNRNGHGWHVHMLLPKWISSHIIDRFWSHGRYRLTDIAMDPNLRGQTMKAVMQAAAARGSGYLSKQWSELVLVQGDHLYEVAQGYAPKSVTGDRSTLAETMAWVKMLFRGRQPTTIWDSSESSEWHGPPAYVLRWSQPMAP